MKNILHVSPFSNLGGGEFSLLLELKNLDRKRFRSFCVCYSDGELSKKLKELDIEVTIFERKGLFSHLSIIFRLSNFIKKNKINLVHVNSLDIRAGIASCIAKCPCVGHLRVIFPYTWRDRLFVRLSSCVIAVSEAVIEAFSRFYPECKDKFILVHNAVDLPKGLKRADLKKEFGLDREAVLIGSAGRIDFWKGYEYFIDSALIIKKQFQNSVFFIFGGFPGGSNDTGDYSLSLKEEVNKVGLRDCFIFAGFRSDILSVIADLDVMVVPSLEVGKKKTARAEGFGRVVIESMAVGVPVVATETGGLKEIIKSGEDGLLVPSADSAGIARAVIKLLTDAEFKSSIIARGKQKINESFSVEKYISTLSVIYLKFSGEKNDVPA